MAEVNASTEGSGSSEINEIISAVLSLFIPGVGQLYNEQMQRGAIVLAAWLIGGIFFWWVFVPIIGALTFGFGLLLYFLWPIVHIAAAYDAYNQANLINAGELTV